MLSHIYVFPELERSGILYIHVASNQIVLLRLHVMYSVHNTCTYSVHTSRFARLLCLYHLAVEMWMMWKFAVYLCFYFPTILHSLSMVREVVERKPLKMNIPEKVYTHVKTRYNMTICVWSIECCHTSWVEFAATETMYVISMKVENPFHLISISISK